MRHHAATDFWHEYLALPQQIRDRADKQFALLKADSHHPSLQFKRVGERYGHEIWSVRVTLNSRDQTARRVFVVLGRRSQSLRGVDFIAAYLAGFSYLGVRHWPM